MTEEKPPENTVDNPKVDEWPREVNTEPPPTDARPTPPEPSAQTAEDTDESDEDEDEDEEEYEDDGTRAVVDAAMDYDYGDAGSEGEPETPQMSVSDMRGFNKALGATNVNGLERMAANYRERGFELQADALEARAKKLKDAKARRAPQAGTKNKR